MCSIYTSGVTRVGDTRGSNWGCYPSVFSSQTWRPFFSRQFCGVTPDFFFAKTDDLFCSSLYRFLLLSLGCHPPRGCYLHLFLPVRPRFSTILCKFDHKMFFLRVSPPTGCHPWAVRPLPTPSDATVPTHWRWTLFSRMGSKNLPLECSALVLL